MAYTASQLAALEEAIASGANTVQYQDRRVTYRTLEEMRSLRDEMAVELGVSADASRSVAFGYRGDGE